MGYQEPSAEGCAAGEDGGVDSGIAGGLVGSVQALRPIMGIRGEDGRHIVVASGLPQLGPAKHALLTRGGLFLLASDDLTTRNRHLRGTRLERVSCPICTTIM